MVNERRKKQILDSEVGGKRVYASNDEHEVMVYFFFLGMLGVPMCVSSSVEKLFKNKIK